MEISKTERPETMSATLASLVVRQPAASTIAHFSGIYDTT